MPTASSENTPRRFSATTARDVYDALHRRWGPQHWWPGDTPLEVAAGAILTQNTAWTNVERAIARLKSARALSAGRLAAMPSERLAELIRPAGYPRVKARRLQAFMRWLRERWGGSIVRWRGTPTARLREELLEVHGVGPETADSILLYAANRPVFVVDAYTRRVLTRHGWIRGKESYDEIARLFTGRLPRDTRLFNEYHALVVRLAKEHCRARPRCGGCPLQSRLPRAVRAAVALLALALAASGCAAVSASPAPEEADSARAAGRTWGGRVVRVDLPERFVIVRCGVFPPPRTEGLTKRGDRETGRIRFTGERRGWYAAALIESGEPAAGDRVVEPSKDVAP
ncbi:MAG: endonuclease III domain-containing protein [Kiritimatiellae bacterium]|nr:endonuclease III domain-containing protein [Kiritimatiellia bacterium]